MVNVIAVFNNRNHSMQFASYLKRIGIPNKTINTPRDLSVACGISVIFPINFLANARNALEKCDLANASRLYVIENDGVFKKYKPIY